MKNHILGIFTFLFLLSNNTPSQNYQWAKGFGDTSIDGTYSNVIDASGNIITIGAFYGTVDFDPGIGTYNVTSGASGTNVFILKLDVNGNFIWVKTFAGASSSNGYGITLDASGNIYATGNYTNIYDFDPGVGTYTMQANGNGDVFVSKLDPNGNFIWAKSMGGPSNETPTGINVDVSGNVLITGSFDGTGDFDPGTSTFLLSTMGFNDFFISKLDANGNFIWANSIGSFGNENSSSITTDINANIYFTGSFDGGVDFDPGPGNFTLFTNGSNDIFISKLDLNGNFVWAKGIGGSGWDVGSSVTLDGSGNIYTIGSFSNTVDFDPNAGVFNITSAGKADIFVSKLDQNGNFIWAKTLGGIGYDIGYGIKTDATGNVFTTGYHEGVADFDPNAGTYTLNTFGCSDIFISKLDMNGNFSWAKNAGGSGCEGGYAISISNNAVYISGSFDSSTCDFNPPFSSTITSNGMLDVFIAKYDNNPLNIVEEEIELTSIFPNPNPGNELFIKNNSNILIESVSLYSILGNLEYSENLINNKNETIRLIDLPVTSGIYILKIYTNQKVFAHKISIE